MATIVYTNTKTRPCHFWVNGDRCKFTAAQCRFAHNLGATAVNQSQPRVQEKVEPPKGRTNHFNEVKVTNKVDHIKDTRKEEDLISLCSFVEESPKAEAPKIETPAVEAPIIEAPEVESLEEKATETRIQKPQGHISNGVPSRGRSPKCSPKATPKNSPKHSPKRTPKQLNQNCNKSPQHASKQSPSPSKMAANGSIAQDLRTAIVQGKDFNYIRNFLASNPAIAVRESLSLSRQGVSAIFSAVAEGRNDVLRLMIRHGADPNARHLPSGIPVLASAIFQNNGAAIVTVAVLLELGADPFVIPRDLWDDNASFSSMREDSVKTQWCDEANKALLSECFSLSVKHYLQEAARKMLDPRKGVKGHATSGGLNIVNRESADHLLIGQEAALRRVNEHLRCHMLCGGNEPLVLAFVGLVGHGKTELACRIGTIQRLSPAFLNSNKPEKTPTVANEGLKADAAHTKSTNSADNINVICLDDMDEVDSQLLTSVLDGNDKATNRKKTVIVLSTTLDITKFPLDYYRRLAPEANDHLMWLAYEAQAKKHLVDVYGHSIASRVASIIPFIPFTPKEASLIAHKSILDTADELTKSMTPTGPNRGDHVGFTVDVDARVCEFIGESFYDINAGARSIHQAVLHKVKLRMVEEYVKAYPALAAGAPGEQNGDDEHGPLNFVIRLETDKSVSVALE